MTQSYNFLLHDGGRSTDKKRRPHDKDCMIRAISTATGISYAQVYDEMIENGCFNPKRGGFIDRFVGQLNFAEKDYHGFKFNWRFSCRQRSNSYECH